MLRFVDWQLHSRSQEKFAKKQINRDEKDKKQSTEGNKTNRKKLVNTKVYKLRTFVKNFCKDLREEIKRDGYRDISKE